MEQKQTPETLTSLTLNQTINLSQLIELRQRELNILMVQSREARRNLERAEVANKLREINLSVGDKVSYPTTSGKPLIGFIQDDYEAGYISILVENKAGEASKDKRMIHHHLMLLKA